MQWERTHQNDVGAHLEYNDVFHAQVFLLEMHVLYVADLRIYIRNRGIICP
jgi:hypothetical protein